MLLFIAILVIVALVWIRFRVARANAAPLGWMSERWLAEYRDSHP